MNTDPALTLRIKYDQGEPISSRDIAACLEHSPLAARLAQEFTPKPLYAVWRLVALAELPFIGTHPYTKEVISYIDTHLATPSGFSLDGKAPNLLPCYNAMLLGAYARLGYGQVSAAQSALAWIKAYQPFERNIPSSWDKPGTKKHGGCLKAVPCFIGVAKAVQALLHYARCVPQDQDAIALAGKGMEYLLRHHLYKRLSDGRPIGAHIQDIAFPPSYQLNVVELLEMAWMAGRLSDPRCADALSYVRGKKADGGWKVSHVYRADGYVPFDRRGKKSEWIGYLFSRYGL